MAFTAAPALTATTPNRTQYEALYDPLYALSFTAQPSAVTTGSKDSATLTVTGLQLGDIVIDWSTNVDLQGMGVSVYVSAANTLTIYLTNNTGGTVTIAAGKWKVLIGRPTWV